MKLQEMLARATGRLLILLAVVAVPAAIYILVLVKHQEAFYTAGNLRAVAEVGAQLNDRLDAVQQIARTFPSDPGVIQQPGKTFVPEGCAAVEGIPEEAAETFASWCRLRQWGSFVSTQWWAAESGSAEESGLDEVAVLIDDRVAIAETVIATQASSGLYCGAYARLRQYEEQLEVAEFDFADAPQEASGLFVQCEEPVTESELLQTLRSYYGSRDSSLLEYAYPFLEDVDSTALAALDLAIVETAYLAVQPMAPGCLARASATLDAVALGAATVAALNAVWDGMFSCSQVDSPLPGDEILERWYGATDAGYWEAAYGTDIERAYLEVSRLLKMLLDRREPVTGLPVASIGEMEDALITYGASATPDERVAALADAVSALERGMDSQGDSCRVDPGYCSHTFDKYVARGQMIAQLKTTAWFRSLEAGQNDTVCPASSRRRPPFRRLDADGNEASYYSMVTVENGQEPAVVAMVCRVPEPSTASMPVFEVASVKRGGAFTPEVIISVPLRDLVESRRVESGLDGILIADCRGDVIFSDTTRQLSVLDVGSLIDSTLKTSSDGCMGPGQSWTKSTSIAGVPMRVFGHPYQPAAVMTSVSPVGNGDAGDSTASGDSDESGADLPEAASGGDALTWYVVGLQSEALFQRNARVMPFEVIVVVAPLVAVAVLAWPLLILVLSGVGARFGHGTPLSFTASAVGGAGVLTIIGIGLVNHGATVELRNQLMWRVADAMQTAFDREIGATLELFDSASVARPPFIDVNESVAQAIARCGGDAVTAGEENEAAPDRRCYAQYDPEHGGALLSGYNRFELAFALRNDGTHEGRHLSLRDAGSSRNSLESRGYFQRASRGLLIDFGVDDDRREFAIEQIRSKDFGWLLTAFAIPAAGEYGASPEAAAVIVIRRMQTFFDPILPAGVGFAVVRNRDGEPGLDGDAWRAGDVLFHSDESRSLVENILSETDDDEGLARTLQNRRADWLNVDYRGLPHRFYTEPLLVPSWSLIVTYDKEALRIYTWRGMLVAASAFLAYLLALVLSACVVERMAQRRWTPVWIVPSAANGRMHVCAALALSAIAALLLAGSSAWVGPSVPPYVLWAVLLGNVFCTYGLLTGHFGQALAATDRAGSELADWPGRMRLRAGANRVGAIVFIAGLLLVASSIGAAGMSGSLWSLGLLILFATLFVVPCPQMQGTKGSDSWFVFFLVALLATVSAVPASTFLRDVHLYQEAAYEKFDLAQVAVAAEQRTATLRAEARRLQPRSFDRAEATGFAVPNDIWCNAFFAIGIQVDNLRCSREESEPGGESEAGPGPTGPEGGEAATTDSREEPRPVLRSATSMFGDAIPPVGTADLIFNDGGRLESDDGAMTWSLAGGTMSVATRDGWEFSTTDGGLFDRDPELRAFVSVAGLISRGALVMASGLLLFLTWRALAGVVATIFGPEDLRRLSAGRRAARAEWASLTLEEKILARSIAGGKLVNCRANELTLRSLAKKGYLRFERGVRIADPAIAEEIEHAQPSEQELAHERSLSGGAWAQVRLPFLTIIGLAVIMLVVTTPEALSSGLGVLAGSAAGVGVIIQLLNLFMRARQ